MLHLVYARCVAPSLRTPVRKRRDADDAETRAGQSDTSSTNERFRGSLEILTLAAEAKGNKRKADEKHAFFFAVNSLTEEYDFYASITRVSCFVTSVLSST